MFAIAPALVSPRVYQRMIWFAVVALLGALLLGALPSLVHQYQPLPFTRPAPASVAPVPASPATRQPPPGLGPVLNATLAADSGADYAVAPLATPADGLRADNPAQRFATTFGPDGIGVAPAGGPAWAMRVVAITTASGSIALAATPPVNAGPRVEYRRDGLTEWYVNGPRGLEQGFTLAAPPAGAAQFTIALAVTGDAPTQADSALTIGGLRYGELTATDAAGTTLPVHLDMADGTIRIAVDATGAQWPVTVDPLVTQAVLAPQTPAGNTTYAFGLRTAIATANGTNTVVIGAPSEMIGTQDEQGAVYVFTGSGGTYTQRARLTASDGVRQNRFGQSVAVTVSGGTTTVAVGTFNVSKAYVYTSSGGAYTETLLVPTDPTNGDGFGDNVAAVTNGGATIIAISAQGHTAVTNTGQGTVYLFSGSGTSFPLQFELNDPNPSAHGFGESIALVSNGGTNTLAVGIYALDNSSNAVRAVMVFTGSGTSYRAVTLMAADNPNPGRSNFGTALAVGVLNGVTTVVISDPPLGDQYRGPGAVYVFAGSGTSYTQTKLTDASGAVFDNFGVSVAVGYSYSQTLVAVGAPGKNSNTLNAADGVLIFTQTGDSYTQSSLPQSNGFAGDYYGYSVAMQAVSNGDPVVVGGAPAYSRSSPGAATVSSWSAQASVRATFGDGSQMLVSPAASNYSGIPFHLVASVVDGNGNPIPPTGITFIVKPNGNTGGLFNASDPASTTLHVTTHDGTSGTTVGQTDTINLFPSDTAGTFTVTAAADGTALSATYTLTIIATLPTPTINAVIPPRTTSAVTRNAVAAQVPGLTPPTIIIDTQKNAEIVIHGSGFVKQTYDATIPDANIATVFTLDLDTSVQFLLETVYVSSTELDVYVTGDMLASISARTVPTTASINVLNPRSSPPPGGYRPFSTPVTLVLTPRMPAQAGSTLTCGGSLDILASSSNLFVPPVCQILGPQKHPSNDTNTGTAKDLVGSNGGEIIATGGGNVRSNLLAGVISNDGGTLVPQHLITNDGGGLVSKPVGASAQNGVPKPSSQSPASNPAQNARVGSAPKRTTASSSSTNGDYIASSDAHAIIMAPPVLSNGIPGTFTRTLAVDGIATLITYTITNLNPHDGHPTTITALSRTAASTGDPAFTLTVTGTGFIAGSVISYGGVQLTTAFISATQVSATVPANLLLYSGALDVLVINPDPNGGASLPATFTVTHATTMTLAGLSPNSIAPNGPAFTLTATGTNFVNGATVEWNSTPLTTTFVSATSLTATVPAALTAHGGAAQVTVADPLGGATVALVFTVLTPNALPPPQPASGPTGRPSPLPGARPPGQGAGSGPPPSPLPPSR